MAKRVLIANRGEIACRVSQACRELGLCAVGIVVAGDEDSRHASFVDEIHTVKSYLDIDELVTLAKQKKIDAVHPGYGFLSERPEFVDALEKAGIAFAGPTSTTMRAVGEKIPSKELAAKVDVPTLPWARASSPQECENFAKSHGFPLLLKASSGGGGKGMRRVNQATELASSAESASAEAEAAFGNGTLFLERLIEDARHIEVQVFGSGGEGSRVLALGERECSLQRRHQKIWEESPAPNLPEAVRRDLHAAALRIAQAVNYRSAGTVEFLVDPQDRFYFLEVNARLQVEHPVTEEVTGVDLVHWQLKQALGLHFELPKTVHTRGHAIEVRICAEDPSRGFAPSPGTVAGLRWPTGVGIRIESGIELGQEVRAQFDSMLAKLIVCAGTRDEALRRLREALKDTVVLGVGTNVDYLLWLCSLPEVESSKVTTRFLGEREFRPKPQNWSWSSELSTRQNQEVLTSPWTEFAE